MKREIFNPAQSFKVQYDLLGTEEIAIDIFSGGGGASHIKKKLRLRRIE